MTPLSQHCTSLDLSKRLKAAGVRQESLFWWWYPDTKPQLRYGSVRIKDYPTNTPISAFTALELIELLPEYLVVGQYSHSLTSNYFVSSHEIRRHLLTHRLIPSA